MDDRPTGRPERDDESAPTDASTPQRCAYCGYDRRGLDKDAVCPECGGDAQVAVRLEDGGAEYVRSLRRAARLLTASAVIGGLTIGVSVLGLLLAFAVYAGGSLIIDIDFQYLEVAMVAGMVLALGLNAVGWWLLTAPHPRTLGAARRGRLWATSRALTAAAVVASLFTIVVNELFLVAVALWIARYLFGALFVTSLQRYEPLTESIRTFTVYIWASVPLTLVCFVVVGSVTPDPLNEVLAASVWVFWGLGYALNYWMVQRRFDAILTELERGRAQV